MSYLLPTQNESFLKGKKSVDNEIIILLYLVFNFGLLISC